MKKIIRILGFTAIVLAFFVNTNSVTKSSSSIALADLVSVNNANAEWWDWCTWCPDPTPYGSVAVPTIELCYDLLQDEDDPFVYTYYPYTGYGTDCEDAQTMGPLYCEPESACDEEEGVIYT